MYNAGWFVFICTLIGFFDAAGSFEEAVRLRFVPFVAPRSLVAPMIGNVGLSLVSVPAVGRGEDMRASVEEGWRMSDMRFGGIVG